MSVEAMTAALRLRTPKLTTTQKFLLVCIANHAGDGGAWPTVETLAGYLEVSERAVQQNIAALVKAGLLTVEVNAGGNSRTPPSRRPNLYHLHLDGAKHAAPHDGGGGVKPGAPRGEAGRADGVKPVAPKTSYNPPEPSDDVSLTLDVAVDPQPSSFERFYAAYPRKAGKPAAGRAFRSAVRDDGIDAIRAGFKVWSAHWSDHAVPLGLIPHPATWLNQKRYNDIPVTPDEKPVNGRRPDAAASIAQTRASHDAEREEFAALMLRGALPRCPDHLWPGYPDEPRMAMFLTNYDLWDLALSHGVVADQFAETWGRHFDIRSWVPDAPAGTVQR